MGLSYPEGRGPVFWMDICSSIATPLCRAGLAKKRRESRVGDATGPSLLLLQSSDAPPKQNFDTDYEHSNPNGPAAAASPSHVVAQMPRSSGWLQGCCRGFEAVEVIPG